MSAAVLTESLVVLIIARPALHMQEGNKYYFRLDFLSHNNYTIFVAQKVGDDLTPRTGRPKSENPKLFEVKARVDQETSERLQAYCKKHSKTITTVVREGINLVLDQEE